MEDRLQPVPADRHLAVDFVVCEQAAFGQNNAKAEYKARFGDGGRDQYARYVRSPIQEVRVIRGCN
jgi:hypothetical protein